MDRKELLLRWLCRFGMIHGFVMMVLYALARIFGCAWFEDPTFAGRLIPVSLAGTLPGLILSLIHI